MVVTLGLGLFTFRWWCKDAIIGRIMWFFRDLREDNTTPWDMDSGEWLAPAREDLRGASNRQLRKAAKAARR